MSGSLLIVGGDRVHHWTFGALLAASRVTGTPFASAGRGGKAALAAAGKALAARRVA